VSRYYNRGQFTAYRAEQMLVGKKAPKDIPSRPVAIQLPDQYGCRASTESSCRASHVHYAEFISTAAAPKP